MCKRVQKVSLMSPLIEDSGCLQTAATQLRPVTWPVRPLITAISWLPNSWSVYYSSVSLVVLSSGCATWRLSVGDLYRPPGNPTIVLCSDSRHSFFHYFLLLLSLSRNPIFCLIMGYKSVTQLASLFLWYLPSGRIWRSVTSFRVVFRNDDMTSVLLSISSSIIVLSWKPSSCKTRRLHPNPLQIYLWISFRMFHIFEG